MNACAEKHGKSVAQILLRWSIQSGRVCLVKSKNPERIDENKDIFDFTLDEEDMTMLDGLDCEYHCSWDPTTLAMDEF